MRGLLREGSGHQDEYPRTRRADTFVGGAALWGREPSGERGSWGLEGSLGQGCGWQGSRGRRLTQDRVTPMPPGPDPISSSVRTEAEHTWLPPRTLRAEDKALRRDKLERKRRAGQRWESCSDVAVMLLVHRGWVLTLLAARFSPGNSASARTALEHSHPCAPLPLPSALSRQLIEPVGCTLLGLWIQARGTGSEVAPGPRGHRSCLGPCCPHPGPPAHPWSLLYPVPLPSLPSVLERSMAFQ